MQLKVTQHKRIYINIGRNKKKIRIKIKKNKMCNKIKCAGQYIVDLINNNISRNVQTGYAGYTYSSNMDDGE